MAVHVQVIFRDGKVKKVLLKPQAVTLGRSSKSDIQVDDPTCSGVHCSLRLSRGVATVKDLDSSNGTFIDKKVVKEETIYLDSEVQFGGISVLLDPTDMNPTEIQKHTPRTGGNQQEMFDLQEGLKTRIADITRSRINVNKKLNEKSHLSTTLAIQKTKTNSKKEKSNFEKRLIIESQKSRQKYSKKSQTGQILKKVFEIIKNIFIKTE